MRYSLLRHFLVLIIFSLTFLAACRHDFPERIPPKAVKGVLDLTDWDFKRDGSVDLSGECEFYWMKHLKPLDFSKFAYNNIIHLEAYKLPFSSFSTVSAAIKHTYYVQ